MCKTELCERVIAQVAKTADLSIDEICSTSRRPEVVDARYVAIYIMIKKGIPHHRIATFMKMSERNVYHVRERFNDRKDYGDPMIERYYNIVLELLKQV